VTEIPAVLRNQRPGALDAGGIDRPIGWAWRRQFGNGLGEFAQIVVAQSLRHVVHGIGDAQVLAKHQ
jgi:hypothetical protein